MLLPGVVICAVLGDLSFSRIALTVDTGVLDPPEDCMSRGADGAAA